MNRNKDLLTYLEKNFAGEYLLNEPLSSHTWYRIGGPADFFVYPQHTEDLVALLHQCQTLDVQTYFIGEGANVLVNDTGYRGVIINLTRHFAEISQENTVMTVDSGVLLKDLILFSENHSLGGLECLSGIPGTIGGALIMNAGTHCGEIGDTVIEVCLLNENLETVTIPAEQISFMYRSTPELQGKPLLGCKVKLHYEDRSLLQETRLALLAERSAKQPLEYPSCGSVFKRPAKHYVGKLVQDLGLKGFRYGDAMISEKHGGFIVNLGHAKASHVRYLIKKIQNDVYTHYGVELEPEVRFLGF